MKGLVLLTKYDALDSIKHPTAKSVAMDWQVVSQVSELEAGEAKDLWEKVSAEVLAETCVARLGMTKEDEDCTFDPDILKKLLPEDTVKVLLPIARKASRSKSQTTTVTMLLAIYDVQETVKVDEQVSSTSPGEVRQPPAGEAPRKNAGVEVKFAIGDEVITKANKDKHLWDNKKAVVEVAENTYGVKVKMLEGEKAGKCRNYPASNLTMVAKAGTINTPPPLAPAAGSQGQREQEKGKEEKKNDEEEEEERREAKRKRTAECAAQLFGKRSKS